MVKDLSQKESLRRKLVFRAVEDYIGADWSEKDKQILGKAIINRDFDDLDEFDRLDALHIISNIADPTYRKNIAVGELS